MLPKTHSLFIPSFILSFITLPGGEFNVTRLMRDLASALQHLHSLGMSHNDVKPENLVFRSE
jgi:serine/threonine protein kinase